MASGYIGAVVGAIVFTVAFAEFFAVDLAEAIVTVSIEVEDQSQGINEVEIVNALQV